MKAILMAAGVGSRISRSINKPKSTLDAGGMPLITRTVDMLLSKGVEVVVVTGYRCGEVEDALKGRDVKFYFNPFYRATNSMASLWFAREAIGGDDLILANADVFWGDGMYEDLMSDDRDIVMLGDESRVSQGDYFFKVKDGVIADFGKELSPENRTTEYVGIAKIASHLTDRFRENLEAMVNEERYDLWWENVLYEHIDTDPVYVRDMSEYFWAEIDYIDDYYRITEFLRTGDISCKNCQRKSI